jgi:hypothetical protein
MGSCFGLQRRQYVYVAHYATHPPHRVMHAYVTPSIAVAALQPDTMEFGIDASGHPYVCEKTEGAFNRVSGLTLWLSMYRVTENARYDESTPGRVLSQLGFGTPQTVERISSATALILRQDARTKVVRYDIRKHFMRFDMAYSGSEGMVMLDAAEEVDAG